LSSQYEYKALQYLKNYLEVAGEVKDIVLKLDPKAKVYVFGSVVRGDYTASSDIDILVVTSDIKLKYELMVAVYRVIDAPVELHVVTQELFERWYKRFIRPEEIVEV
jgi:predicted nucleotidyltransferase